MRQELVLPIVKRLRYLPAENSWTRVVTLYIDVAVLSTTDVICSNDWISGSVTSKIHI